MRKNLYVYKLFFVAVSLFLVAASPALPALAPPGELAEGISWSYGVHHRYGW
ncbi:MAG: hypothetical protein GX894_01830 [Clostridia bacterium]|nr:hypothetical protein [Clostridia bacterium]